MAAAAVPLVLAVFTKPASGQDWSPPLPDGVTVHYHTSHPCYAIVVDDSRLAGAKITTGCWEEVETGPTPERPAPAERLDADSATALSPPEWLERR